MSLQVEGAKSEVWVGGTHNPYSSLYEQHMYEAVYKSNFWRSFLSLPAISGKSRTRAHHRETKKTSPRRYLNLDTLGLDFISMPNQVNPSFRVSNQQRRKIRNHMSSLTLESLNCIYKIPAIAQLCPLFHLFQDSHKGFHTKNNSQS